MDQFYITYQIPNILELVPSNSIIISKRNFLPFSLRPLPKFFVTKYDMSNNLPRMKSATTPAKHR